MKGRIFWIVWEKVGLLLVLVLFFVILAFTSPLFLKPFNLMNNFRAATFAGIAAIGMTFVIITGEFDLSIGSMLAVLGIICAALIPITGVPLAIIITLVVGFLFGIMNGAIITKLKIPAFITTLGMLYIFRAIAYISTKNTPVSVQDPKFLFLANGKVLGIYLPIVIMVVLYLIGFFVLRFTAFGRYVNAIGSNKEAAFIAGINVDLIKTIVFGIVGLFVAVSAVLITSRLQSANPGQLGLGFEFQVITIAILGGTSLKGGSGSLGGAFVASLILFYLYNGMNLLKIESYWQYIVVGLVMLFAVAFDQLRIKLSGQAGLT